MNDWSLVRCFGGGSSSSWRTITMLVLLLGLKSLTFSNGFVTTPRRPITAISRPITAISPSIISSGALGTGYREVMQQPSPQFSRRNNIRRMLLLCATSSPLPSMDQLLNDPFMKQVQYGSLLTEELMRHEKNTRFNNKEVQDSSRRSSAASTAALRESIQAQLSHSEGIRGFMVSYLTADDDNDEEEDPSPVPEILLDALKRQAEKDPSQLIPLACMNVIMPVAMTTMHTDPESSARSATTAKRGIRVLQALLLLSSSSSDIPELLDNVQAIWEVARSSTGSTTTLEDDEAVTFTSDKKLIKYWTEFFEKWGYGEEQKKDIASAMTQLLQKA